MSSDVSSIDMEINNGTRSIWIVDDMPDSDRIAIELPERRIGLNKQEVLLLRNELDKLLNTRFKPKKPPRISAYWRKGKIIY